MESIESRRCALIRQVLLLPPNDLIASRRSAADRDAVKVWIPIEVAAARLGRSIGHVARLCRDRLQFEELARLAKPADGGKPQWMINPAFDPRLSASSADSAPE